MIGTSTSTPTRRLQLQRRHRITAKSRSGVKLRVNWVPDSQLGRGTNRLSALKTLEMLKLMVGVTGIEPVTLSLEG